MMEKEMTLEERIDSLCYAIHDLRVDLRKYEERTDKMECQLKKLLGIEDVSDEQKDQEEQQ